MQWNSLLKQAGFAKVGNLYKNPVTSRLNTRSNALNNAAALIGYKDYDSAKEAFRSKAYKRFTRFAKESGQQNDKKFNELFAKAWADRNKKLKSGKPRASHNLTKLLKHVNKLPRQFKSPYRHPL